MHELAGPEPQGFEGLAVMVANLTSFFRQSPEPLRLVSGSLSGDAVLFRKPTGLGIFTAAIHHITYRQRTGSGAREMS